MTRTAIYLSKPQVMKSMSDFQQPSERIGESPKDKILGNECYVNYTFAQLQEMWTKRRLKHKTPEE